MVKLLNKNVKKCFLHRIVEINANLANFLELITHLGVLCNSRMKLSKTLITQIRQLKISHKPFKSLAQLLHRLHILWSLY